MTEATTHTYESRLAETLPEVRDRIRAAASASGRAAEAVRLIAVTKGHPPEAIRAALAAGLTDLGENRVDELERKCLAFEGSPVKWHFIGHIQSRKARSVMELAQLIHSVDSTKLAERLSRMAAEEGRTVSVLVQVNTSGEESKGGLEGGGVAEEVHAIAELPGLRVEGLMTMAPFVDEEAVLTRAFEGLRRVSEQVRALTDRVGPELSMGMTNDLDIAIREGSTMVRIGTALFGERPG